MHNLSAIREAVNNLRAALGAIYIDPDEASQRVQAAEITLMELEAEATGEIARMDAWADSQEMESAIPF